MVQSWQPSIYDKKDPIRERYDTHGVQVCNKGKCEEREEAEEYEDDEKEPARHLIPDQFNSCLVQVFPDLRRLIWA